MAFLITWIFKANKTAVVITVQWHDLLLPAVPALFFWQYKLAEPKKPSAPDSNREDSAVVRRGAHGM